MWNDRYLHLDSNHGDYTLYSKNTIGVSFLKDKHISDLIIKEDGKAPFSVDVRLYYSRCYIIQNDSEKDENLHIHAYTYRVLCPVNAIVMYFLAFMFLFKLPELIKEVVFFGASVLCLIASLTTALTYFEQQTLSLPGVAAIKESVFHTVRYILVYSFFLIHFLSFVLRISLNYYNISINEFNHIPHIVSFFGPLVCRYQYWVVALYVVIALNVLPCNKDGLWMSLVLGGGLLFFLMLYGPATVLQNLTNGVVIAVMLLTLLPFLWKNGYFYLFFPSPNFRTKKERERNLKTVIDE